jgi:hypothetical protein
MSKMSDLSLDIQEMLEDDIAPQDIARILEIPVSWVYTEIEQEELSPFETINS